MRLGKFWVIFQVAVVYMYAQKLLLKDDTGKQATGTSEIKLINCSYEWYKVQRSYNVDLYVDIWQIELWSCNSQSLLHKLPDGK